jgi:DNA polymerase V
MSNHGGKRENAGRPRGQGKFGEPTVSVRVPQSQGATIKDFLDAYQRKKNSRRVDTGSKLTTCAG